jgi:hypothetical protein
MRRASLVIRTATLALALAAPLGAACGGDDDDVVGGTPDAAPDACDQIALLPIEYRPIASVSTGALDTSPGEGATDAVIDATAGGLINAADNPFLYIDLEQGTKVAIDDVEALDSDAWDIAFKRPNIRVNSGDSGTGDVAVAVVAGSLADVTEAPADGEFETDDWSSDSCTLLTLADGTPATAFGEWYDYDDATHILTPKAEVHVVRTRSGDLVKLAIETYYGDEGDPTRGAVYRVSWAPL